MVVGEKVKKDDCLRQGWLDEFPLGMDEWDENLAVSGWMDEKKGMGDCLKTGMSSFGTDDCLKAGMIRFANGMNPCGIGDG